MEEDLGLFQSGVGSKHTSRVSLAVCYTYLNKYKYKGAKTTSEINPSFLMPTSFHSDIDISGLSNDQFICK